MFFLDHTTKTTTFIDPRLPIVQPPLNPGQVMPLPLGRYRAEEEEAGAASGGDLPTGELAQVYNNDRCPAHPRQNVGIIYYL